MIHINPYYLFCHVVFINVEKRFICIEKEVYQKIHSLIFSGQRSSPKQRKQIRELFYTSYYDYVYKNKNVNVQKFNDRLFTIYTQVEVRQFDGSTQIVDKDGDLILSGEMPFYLDENVCEKSYDITNDQAVIKKVDRFIDLKMKDVFESDVVTDFNSAIVENSKLFDVVEYLSFNRCINILRKFSYYDTYVLRDDVEFSFLKYCLYFISKYRLRFFKRQFDYICESCFGIGCHLREYRKTGDEKKCYKSLWFDFNHILDLSFYATGDIHAEKDEYIVNDKLTTYSGREHFRIGFFEYDRSTSFNYHTIVMMNNNRIELQKFKSNAHSFGLELSFRFKTEILSYNSILEWLELNYDSSVWNLKYKEMCDLYNHISSSSVQDVSNFSLAFGSDVSLGDFSFSSSRNRDIDFEM